MMSVGLGLSPATYRPLTVRKANDETISSDDTMTADAELKLALPINSTYTVLINVGYNSGTTPDFKFDILVPTGATLDASVAYFNQAAGTVSVVGNLASDTDVAALGAGPTDIGVMVIACVLMGSTAGDTAFRWAQNTNTASNTTVYAGSSMIAFPHLS